MEPLIDCIVDIAVVVGVVVVVVVVVGVGVVVSVVVVVVGLRRVIGGSVRTRFVRERLGMRGSRYNFVSDLSGRVARTWKRRSRVTSLSDGGGKKTSYRPPDGKPGDCKGLN